MRDYYDVVVVEAGTIVCELRFKHTAEGWQTPRETLRRFETLAVEQLLACVTRA